jgi:hypothetical protein
MPPIRSGFQGIATTIFKKVHLFSSHICNNKKLAALPAIDYTMGVGRVCLAIMLEAEGKVLPPYSHSVGKK